MSEVGATFKVELGVLVGIVVGTVVGALVGLPFASVVGTVVGTVVGSGTAIDGAEIVEPPHATNALAVITASRSSTERRRMKPPETPATLSLIGQASAFLSSVVNGYRQAYSSPR
jgi:uncharacterized oligopeptide transporter (OPT) family protein